MNQGDTIDSQILDLMLRAGSRWVLWLLIGLSLAAVAVMAERLWFFLRGHYLSNRIFKDYDELFEAIKRAWNSLDAQRLQTLTRSPWIERAA